VSGDVDDGSATATAITTAALPQFHQNHPSSPELLASSNVPQTPPRLNGHQFTNPNLVPPLEVVNAAAHEPNQHIAHPCNAQTPEIARYLYSKLFNHYVAHGKAASMLDVRLSNPSHPHAAAAAALISSSGAPGTQPATPLMMSSELNLFLSQCTEQPQYQFTQKAKAALWVLMDQIVLHRQTRGLNETDFVAVARMIATWQRRGPPAPLTPEEEAILKLAASPSMAPVISVPRSSVPSSLLPYGLSLLSESELQALYNYRSKAMAQSSSSPSSVWLPKHLIQTELPMCSVVISLVGNALEVGVAVMNSRIAAAAAAAAALARTTGRGTSPGPGSHSGRLGPPPLQSRQSRQEQAGTSTEVVRQMRQLAATKTNEQLQAAVATISAIAAAATSTPAPIRSAVNPVENTSTEEKETLSSSSTSTRRPLLATPSSTSITTVGGTAILRTPGTTRLITPISPSAPQFATMPLLSALDRPTSTTSTHADSSEQNESDPVVSVPDPDFHLYQNPLHVQVVQGAKNPGTRSQPLQTKPNVVPPRPSPLISARPEHLRHVSLPGDIALAPSALDSQFRSFLSMLQTHFNGDLSLFQRSFSVFCSKVRRAQVGSSSDLSLTLSQLCWRQAPAAALLRLRRLDSERYAGSESETGAMEYDDNESRSRADGDKCWGSDLPSALNILSKSGPADADDDDAPVVVYAGLSTGGGKRGGIARKSVSGPANAAPLIVPSVTQPAGQPNQNAAAGINGANTAASSFNTALIRSSKKRTAFSKFFDKFKQSFTDSSAPKKRQDNQLIAQAMLRASTSPDVGLFSIELVESCGISKGGSIAFTAYIIPSTQVIAESHPTTGSRNPDGCETASDVSSSTEVKSDVGMAQFAESHQSGLGGPSSMEQFDPNAPPIVVPAPILALSSTFLAATSGKTDTSAPTALDANNGTMFDPESVFVTSETQGQSPAQTGATVASMAWSYFLQWKSTADTVPVHSSQFWDSKFLLPWCSPADVLVVDAHGGDPLSLSSSSYEVLGRISLPAKVILGYCLTSSPIRPLSAWIPLLTQQGNTQLGGALYLTITPLRIPRIYYNSYLATQLTPTLRNQPMTPPSLHTALRILESSSSGLGTVPELERISEDGPAATSSEPSNGGIGRNDDQLASLQLTISAIEQAATTAENGISTLEVEQELSESPGSLSTAPAPQGNPHALRQSISVFCVTMNMGNAPPPATPEELTALLPPGHMVYAIAAQECRYDPRYDWTNCRDDWAATLVQHLGTSYTMVKYHSLNDIRLAVFVANELVPRVSDIICDTVATGLANLVGNKGAVAIGLRLDHTSICFVSSHLAAHQDKVALRNENFREIVKRTRFGRKYPYDGGANIDLVNQFDHLIFMGDLNYRIHYGQDPLARTPKEEDMRVLVDLIHQGDVTLQAIASSDQLNLERSQNRAFFGFNEGALLFRPTYKVLPGEELVYSAERLPAWCDRVLYKSLPGSESHLKLMAYTSAESVMTSDHKPVSACFQLYVTRHPPAKLSSIPYCLPIVSTFFENGARRNLRPENCPDEVSSMDLTPSGRMVFDRLHTPIVSQLPYIRSILERVMITLEIANLGADNLLSVQERHDISEDRRAESSVKQNAVVSFFKQVSRGLQPSAMHPYARITSPIMKSPYITNSIKNTVSPRWQAGSRVQLRTNNPKRLEDAVFNIEILSSGPATDGALGFASLSLRSSGIASQLLNRINQKVAQMLALETKTNDGMNSRRAPDARIAPAEPPSLLMRGSLDTDSQSAGVPFHEFVTYAGLPTGEVFGTLNFHISLM